MRSILNEMKKSWLTFILIAIGIALVKGTEVAFAIKPGVYGTLQPTMDPVLPAISAVWRLHRLSIPTVTSIQDGVHKAGSKHETGEALDIRLKDVPLTLHEILRQEVADILGSSFDVVHEYHGSDRDHLHIEYDPD